MLLGLDHLIIACPDPDAAAAELARAVGLRAGGGGRHEALGTFNRLVWLGDSYLELIGVFDRALAERSWVGAPACRVLDAGGGFVSWAVATDDLAGEVARLRAAGSAISEPLDGERRRPDGRVVRWRLATPPRLGPQEPPFLIEHDAGSAEWTAEDRRERATERHPAGGHVRLRTLEVPVADPGAAGMRTLRAVGIGPFRPSLAGAGAREAAIGGQSVRYARARPPSAATPSPGAVVHLVVVGSAEDSAGATTSGATVAGLPSSASRATASGATASGASAAAPSSEPVAVDLLGCRFVVRRT